jgi:hypothetical protein
MWQNFDKLGPGNNKYEIRIFGKYWLTVPSYAILLLLNALQNKAPHGIFRYVY